jgi:predicted O-linked N-acetylglucosamine transferase (SPINDLY family)
LPELVTTNVTAYEARAIEFAREPAKLEELRARLARNRLTKPLFDIERFRRHLESAYETMWDIHQRGEEPHTFDVRRGPVDMPHE